MAARYEISVSRVSDETGMVVGNTVGMVSFMEDKPTEVTAINPLDYKTLLALKGFVDGQLAEAQKLAKEVG
jgi:hypothetical protein